MNVCWQRWNSPPGVERDPVFNIISYIHGAGGKVDTSLFAPVYQHIDRVNYYY